MLTLVSATHSINNPTLKDFEPRLGFAWDPLHNGKTAIRGGAGLFDVLPMPYQFILLTTQCSFFCIPLSTDPGAGTFFNGLTSFPDNTLRSTFIPHPKRNYVAQWNLNSSLPRLWPPCWHTWVRGEFTNLYESMKQISSFQRTVAGICGRRSTFLEMGTLPSAVRPYPNGPPDDPSCGAPRIPLIRITARCEQCSTRAAPITTLSKLSWPSA